MKKVYEIWRQTNSAQKKRYRVIGGPWHRGNPTEYGTYTSKAAAKTRVKELEIADSQDDWADVEQIVP